MVHTFGDTNTYILTSPKKLFECVFSFLYFKKFCFYIDVVIVSYIYYIHKHDTTDRVIAQKQKQKNCIAKRLRANGEIFLTQGTLAHTFPGWRSASDSWNISCERGSLPSTSFFYSLYCALAVVWVRCYALCTCICRITSVYDCTVVRGTCVSIYLYAMHGLDICVCVFFSVLVRATNQNVDFPTTTSLISTIVLRTCGRYISEQTFWYGIVWLIQI